MNPLLLSHMAKKKLWSGRFTKELSGLVENFTESISFDKRLALYDIDGSIAHAQMLAYCKIISLSDSKKIIQGLNTISQQIKKNTFKYKKELEDIHMNIESALIKLIGETGKKLHTARSRNDQVLLDIHLYLKEIIYNIIQDINKVQKALIQLAEKNIDLIIPGYTHLQQAQPVLVSHYFMAYFFMFQRDKERFKQNLKSVDELPLGAGALAGVNYKTDRRFLAKLLKFSKVSDNSMDTVSNRDFMVEFLSHSSVLAMHFSRIAEDLIIWNTQEFNYIEIDDSFTTGSSIMPNKKNPDVLELIRGKTGLVYGHLLSLLTILKGLPLTYNRDLQEDKKILFQSIDTIKSILSIIPDLLNNITLNQNQIEKHLKTGYLLATDIADYLVQSGMPFRQAHHIVGEIIQYCNKKQKSIFDLKLDEFKKFNKSLDKKILSLLNYQQSIKSKQSYGSTSFQNVKLQIKKARQLVQK